MSDIDPNVSLKIGRLGPYAVVRPLGHGGMASVYEAVHIGLGKRVALKVMQAHMAANETTAARFVREGRAVAKVRHPHVVEVFDVGSHEGVPYLVMELLEGVDLAEYLKCNTKLMLRETIDIMLPVISAVVAAHDAGIVHRDLKPGNIFLAKNHHGKVHPKVVDFGISTFMEKDGDPDLTRTQTMLGTVRYMSPEQTRGAKFADARSDQYSLGVMLYLCTTGDVPFTGEGVYELIHAIRNAPLAPPSSLNAALPGTFDAVVLKALARDPADRFASVAELGRALLPFAGRRSSAGWEREFPPEEGLTDTRPGDAFAPRAVAPSRSPEDATAMSTVSETRHPRAVRRGAVIALAGIALAFAIVAAVAVGMLGSRSRDSASTGGALPSVTSSPQPSAGVSATASVDPAPTASATATPTATASATATATATANATATAKLSASSSPARPWRPPPPSPPRPKTGNNGAPILE